MISKGRFLGFTMTFMSATRTSGSTYAALAVTSCCCPSSHPFSAYRCLSDVKATFETLFPLSTALSTVMALLGVPRDWTSLPSTSLLASDQNGCGCKHTSPYFASLIASILDDVRSAIPHTVASVALWIPTEEVLCYASGIPLFLLVRVIAVDPTAPMHC